jgi:hypothetical protein
MFQCLAFCLWAYKIKLKFRFKRNSKTQMQSKWQASLWYLWASWGLHACTKV